MDRKPFPVPEAGLNTDGRIRHCQEENARMSKVELATFFCLPDIPEGPKDTL